MKAVNLNNLLMINKERRMLIASKAISLFLLFIQDILFTRRRDGSAN